MQFSKKKKKERKKKAEKPSLRIRLRGSHCGSMVNKPD